MTTELQNKVWSILPKEFKEEVNDIYLNAVVRHPCGYNYKTDLLKYLFGYHNLTSDEEGEEMLTCEKYKVEEALNYCDELDSISGSHNMLNWGKQIIAYLFGSKCLPDELNEDNFAKSEPKNEGTRQEQCVPKNAESGTHSFNHILKDGFSKERRLNIATTIAAGWLACHGMTNPKTIAIDALAVADILMSEAEKGGEEE